MTEICYEIEEWIEETVSKPIETWVDQQEERCRTEPCNPWLLCLNKLVCWMVTVAVKVIHWVTETVVKLVTRTVCTLLAASIGLVIGLAVGLFQVVVGLFTLDWARIVDGALLVITSTVGFFATVFRVLTLGDTIAFFIEEWNEGTLRRHVRHLLQAKYDGRQLAQIREALGVDAGAFGWRVRGRSVRVYLDSHHRVDSASDVPDLVRLHEDGIIDLFALAGFDWDRWTHRSRFLAVHFGSQVLGGGGLGPEEASLPRLTRQELQTYLDSRGTEGPSFRIYPISEVDLGAILAVTEEKARALGLLLSWEREDIRVTDPVHIVLCGLGCSGDESHSAFLRDVVERASTQVDPEQALEDLCHPTVVAVFRYEDPELNGVGGPSFESLCSECFDCGDDSGLNAGYVSGATFRDRLPVFVWRYVAVHELGHSLGLCHVNEGWERIMRAGNATVNITPTTVLDYLYLYGEPHFVLDEALQVWDSIVEHVPADCLAVRASP